MVLDLVTWNMVSVAVLPGFCLPITVLRVTYNLPKYYECERVDSKSSTELTKKRHVHLSYTVRFQGKASMIM